MGNAAQLTDQQFKQLLTAVARPVEPPVQGNDGARLVAAQLQLLEKCSHVIWEKTASEHMRNEEIGCKMLKTKLIF